MTTFIQNFKSKAHNKNLTSDDMLALCLHKTLKAKTEDKAQLLNFFIQKAFTPKGGSSWDALHKSAYRLALITRPALSRDTEGKMINKRTILGIDLSEVFTITEIELFDELVQKVKTYKGELA